MSLSTVNILARDIKLAHSVFALPFALLAAFWAADGYPGHVEIALLVGCMFFARTWAMLANRYVDRELDAANPRTAGRALPAGRVSARQVRRVMAAAGASFIACAAGFGLADGNWWPALFAVPVLAWLGVYGLFKRFTVFAHFFLGSSLALSPIAAGVAIAPGSLGHPTPWLLAAFVLLWVAGFDIIYALQDIDVDRRDGLHSVPARLGTTAALFTAKFVHLLALVMLMLTQRLTESFRYNRIVPEYEISYFTVGLVIVAVALIVEHRAATRGQFSMAFFTANGVISIALGALGIADVLTWP